MGAPQGDSPPQPPHARFSGVVRGLAVLLLPALAILLYRPGADGPLVFDDSNTIYYNFRIQTLQPLAQFLGSARPLTDLSYAIDLARGRGGHPRLALTNIALHALTGMLVCALGFATLGLRCGRFAAARVRGLIAIATTTPCRGIRLTSAAALPVVVAAGLASKDIAVAIPVTLLLYDWRFLAGRRQPRPGLHWGLVALAASPLLLGEPVLLSGVVSRGAETTAGFAFDRFTPWQYLGTQVGVVLHYVRLIVAPIGLCLDYDWPVARVRLWADPVALYQDGVERAPANPRALGPKYIGLLPMTSLYLGHLALLAKDWPTAIARFEEALQHGNLEVRGLILPYLARAHARLGQYDQARARLAEVLREDPNNRQAHRLMQELGGPERGGLGGVDLVDFVDDGGWPNTC